MYPKEVPRFPSIVFLVVFGNAAHFSTPKWSDFDKRKALVDWAVIHESPIQMHSNACLKLGCRNAKSIIVAEEWPELESSPSRAYVRTVKASVGPRYGRSSNVMA